MKVLLFGGSGQVGFELQRALAGEAELVVPGFGAVPRVELANFGALEKMIAGTRPDLVVNAAAYTEVDSAETDRERASAVNTDAPGVMARAADEFSTPIVHYSTDYIFDGSGMAPRREDDPAAPLNHYGASKLAGEEAVRTANPQHLILRTSWVYAPRGKNFALTMLRLAKEREELRVVADQFGAPTSAGLVAHESARAIMRTALSPELFGTYHLVAGGETSWHGYARYLLQSAVTRGLIARVPKIEGVTSAAFAAAAPRPMNSRLSNAKFQESFETVLPHWQVGVDSLIGHLARVAAA